MTYRKKKDKPLPYEITTMRGKRRSRSRAQDKKFHAREIDHTHVYPNGRRKRFTY